MSSFQKQVWDLNLLDLDVEQAMTRKGWGDGGGGGGVKIMVTGSSPSCVQCFLKLSFLDETA